MSGEQSPSAEFYRPFVNVFVPFAMILAFGNILYSELSPSMLLGQWFYPDVAAHLPAAAATNMTLGRVVVTILISFLFAIPALTIFALYDLRTAPPIVYRYWQLCWSFAYLAYAFHAYYSTGPWFDWDFRQIIERQTWYVVFTNYLLLFLWGIDVLVSLLRGQGGRPWFYRYQWLTHLMFAGSAFVAAVIFAKPKEGTPRSLESWILGWVMALSFGCCLLARGWFGSIRRAPEQSS